MGGRTVVRRHLFTDRAVAKRYAYEKSVKDMATGLALAKAGLARAKANLAQAATELKDATARLKGLDPLDKKQKAMLAQSKAEMAAQEESVRRQLSG